jgi:hypothetical protein
MRCLVDSAPDLDVAREKYEAFVAEGVSAGKRPDLVGGPVAECGGMAEHSSCSSVWRTPQK